ncbi:I78 family peptidase inhibitor [Streptomyces sp. NPDC014894]|uniref:I78 family peptidase inhibitor n=1 Tax=unclassified Streptomyces TaxID=2593676 RepID=UPI00370046F5
MAPTPRSSDHPDDSADSTDAYVGLSAESAERRARERGWSTVRSLPPGAIITLEFLSGRLNFEVKGGTVIRCWSG